MMKNELTLLCSTKCKLSWFYGATCRSVVDILTSAFPSLAVENETTKAKTCHLILIKFFMFILFLDKPFCLFNVLYKPFASRKVRKKILVSLDGVS